MALVPLLEEPVGPRSALQTALANTAMLLAMTPPVQNLQDAARRLAACEVDVRRLGVLRLALFGSVRRGQPRPDSDVDVLVQFAPGTKTYAKFLELTDLLELHLGRRVELVTTEALSPFIGPRILAEAADVLRAA